MQGKAGMETAAERSSIRAAIAQPRDSQSRLLSRNRNDPASVQLRDPPLGFCIPVGRIVPRLRSETFEKRSRENGAIRLGQAKSLIAHLVQRHRILPATILFCIVEFDRDRVKTVGDDAMDGTDLPLVRWTVRLAVACYAARVLMDAGDFGSLRARRSLWTVGLVFYLAHVVAAFQLVHGWSHAAAWEETARQTFERTGWRSGVGVWVNYAFTLLWTVDVAAWWIVGPGYSRRFRRVSFVVQSAFAFLVFNATVVFGPAFWRPVAAACGLIIAVALVVRVKRQPLRHD